MATYEFEVGGKRYQRRSMDIFDQLIIAKRLSKMLKQFVSAEVIEMLMSMSADDTPGTRDPAKLAAMAGPLLDGIYQMSDDDTKTIIKLALKPVLRMVDGGGWSNLTTPTGELMYQDIPPLQLMQIAIEVIKESIGDFFSTAP